MGLTESYRRRSPRWRSSGLGVAAFHPEGARYANYVSRGQRGRGMSMFSLGGNAGFALGPLLVTPAVLAFGLHGTLLALIPLWLAAGLLIAELGRLRGFAPAAGARSSGGNGSAERDMVGPFARLASVVGLRSVVFFGLQAFIPIYFVEQFDRGKAAGNAALSVMLVAGAVGTYVGGRLVDRLGRRVIVVGSMATLCPLHRHDVARRALAGDAAAGSDRLRRDRQLLDHGRDGPGVPAEPARAGLRDHAGRGDRGGGLAAAALGVLADATSLETTMWTIALVPLPALLLAISLPPTDHDRKLAAGTRKPRESGAFGAGHGSPLNYYVPGLVSSPGRRDTPGRLDRPPARGPARCHDWSSLRAPRPSGRSAVAKT